MAQTPPQAKGRRPKANGLPHVAQILTLKNVNQKRHVLVGSSAVQVAFFERVTGLQVALADSVSDDFLVGESQACQVELPSVVDFSVKDHVQMWSLGPIEPRSTAVNVIVKAAAAMIKFDLSKEVLHYVGDAITNSADNGDAESVDALLFSAVWHLSDPNVIQVASTPFAYEKHPWEEPWAFCGRTNIHRRLKAVYLDLVGYALAVDDDWSAAKALGISPSKWAWLKTLKLDAAKVEKSICCLSRQPSQDAFITAATLGGIWAQ